MSREEQVEGFRQHRYTAPPTATTILLVRHGESAPAHADRPFDLVDGQGDPPLHANGQQQAQRLAARLARERVDAIYVTTMRRTHETAAPVAAALGLTPIVEADLREVHLGEWEGGLLRVRAAAGDPLFRRIFDEERWDVIPGAESHEIFEARTLGAIRRIALAHPGGRVVAVTHGGVIGELLRAATSSRGFAFSGADNASISEIVLEERELGNGETRERIVVRRYNDTAHLDE
jgi:probable phosphoglycerate mutase